MFEKARRRRELGHRQPGAHERTEGEKAAIPSQVTVAPGDVVIAISKGGASREIVDLVGRVRDRGATTVALTAVSDSELGRGADICVTVTSSDDVDPGGVIAMGSTLATAVWGDALAYTLMRLRGYTWDEVLHSHPAGAVGQIEHAPDELPPLSLA